MPYKLIEKLFSMSERTWRRHANPWSVWTRLVTGLPLIGLSVWSRDWIGTWAAVPVLVTVLWLWLNPRVFPEPRSTDNWASQGVLGERIWLVRRCVPIPTHHMAAAKTLLSVGAAGFILFAYGLWQLNLWPTLLGGVVAFFGKLWYFDRMVWLYREMKDQNDEYASWGRK